MTWNTVSVLCMSQLGSSEWEIHNVFAVFQVGSLLEHCPFPCDVLAVFLVGTLPLAPSVNREEMVQLSQELEEACADKVILEARVDSMTERLCKCSEGSPRVREIGLAAEPIELEDEELVCVTPPMTSSPTEEEVPSLTKGPP